MKIGSPAVSFVYHLGAHCTDEDMLIRSLLQDGKTLARRKIIVPRPRTYRSRLSDAANTHRETPMPDAERQKLYDTIMKGYPAERVIFSQENVLCMPARVFDAKGFYEKASFRSTWLRALFPDNPCEFFIAVRNPATYIPAALRQDGVPGYAKFMQGVDPRGVRWSTVIQALQDNNPGCPITVWCNEDTPLIWPTVLREIADVDLDFTFRAEFEVLKSIMAEDGFARMQSYLQSHKPTNEIQRRRIFAAFLDKFASDEAIEEEIDLPGWTPELVEEITAAYEDDIYVIERMSGINFIAT